MIFKGLDALHIQPPKTGGTTIRYEVLKQLEPELAKKWAGNFMMRMVGDKTYNPVRKSARKAHTTASEWLDILGEYEFNNLWKFGFIRNPFDQIRSLFKQLTVMNTKVNPAFRPYKRMKWEDFVMGDGEHSMIGNTELIDQYSYFVNQSGAIIVNKVYLFDDYAKSVREISKKLGVRIDTSRKWRETDKGGLMYTPEMIEKVMDNFSQSYDLYRKIKFQSNIDVLS